MFVILMILALAAVIVYLLSLLNSKKFFLVPESGQLTVKKGIFFPVGSELYQPKDPNLAQLYAPIELPAELRQAKEMAFDDLPSLNREFAKHLIKLAAEMVFSNDAKRYAMGKSYINRAGNFQGLDSRQLQQIQALSADVDYLEAMRVYLEVEKSLEKALKKFKQAETFGTGRFSDAGDWIRKITVLLQAIRQTKAAGIGASNMVPLVQQPPAMHDLQDKPDNRQDIQSEPSVPRRIPEKELDLPLPQDSKPSQLPAGGI
jgi:hypothetical protein